MEAGVVLKMQGICMTFPGVKALEGVDLTLKKGEIRALMGENGAGKSTLIKCLTGVNKFEAGEIYLEGFDHPIVNKDTMDAQKKGISTVYQEVNLCPNLSVAENLYIGREPLTKLGTVNRKAMNRQAAALMKQLELDVDVTRNLEEYSLALQQMIAIARAVDMDCKVLILDEPTSSLDDREVEKLFTMMRRLKEKGVGIIFVTHFLEQVYAVCDMITVLRNGELLCTLGFSSKRVISAAFPIYCFHFLVVHTVYALRKCHCISKIHLEILRSEDLESTNENSLVYKFCYKEFSMLFCGDIEEKAERLLLDIYGDALQADVLKVPHHGSASATSDALLEAVQPQYAVISSGEDRNLLPRNETLKWLADHGVEIFRTDENGGIATLTDGAETKICTENGK